MTAYATAGGPAERRVENPDPLLTAAEAGELLNASEGFVRDLVRKRRIRFVRMGRLLRIPESAIAEYVEKRTVEPIDRKHRSRLV